jgi:uncharacterized protein YbjQ (UPF0145 family)
MIKRILFASLLIVVSSSMANARNTRLTPKIQDVLNRPDYQEKVGNSIAFYFANQPQPQVVQNLGEFVTNKKTNAFGKSDEEACEWVMMSALIQLRDRAVAEGGNAVVNIESYYDKDEIPDKSEYECRAGAFVAGVALKGTVAKIAK